MDGIHHIALRVNDCVEAARFYEQACGLREVRRFLTDGEPRSIWLRAGSTVLMLERSIRGVGPDRGSGHILVFPVDDLAAAENRLRELGIAITDRTAATLFVSDPDGHRAGLSVYRFEETTP
jgi:catechol 2,3-dioxygenase-like lactoylglutathione lyase family enzyme